MQIACVEISNFRKLLSVRIDFAPDKTLFVGSNNSGKTSAMLALRIFLADGGSIKTHDFTLAHWETINALGRGWEQGAQDPLEAEAWAGVLPSLDLWLAVQNDELHHVSALIPTLEWSGGTLGVRRRWEPVNVAELRGEYLKARGEVAMTMTGLPVKEGEVREGLTLWPRDLIHFLDRRLSKLFTLKSYLLDPQKLVPTLMGQAQPQRLPPDSEPLDSDPLRGLIRVDDISAQRTFGQAPDGDSVASAVTGRDARRLSDQLRKYYTTHLDPSRQPGPADLEALKAMEAAQSAFDERLNASFATAFREVEGLGYPGLTDPRIKVSTSLRAIDGLNHDSAVSFELDVTAKVGVTMQPLRVPEGHNGLGYQNLISIVFRLMGFRDAWMRVGKAATTQASEIEPLHLVLVEEPEAHLHAQVQQVFIRKGYEILRAHSDLGGERRLRTQMVVSSHSSHVAHEVPFSCIRYFKRLPAGMPSPVPVSTVVNLSSVFGDGAKTDDFVTRYLKAQHADLFFADAVILVEGAAERMLVPHFIQAHHPFLHQSYVTLLEIAGSHAHRLRPLIEHLGLLTLIVTDLDAGEPPKGVSQPPRRGSGQQTNNETLKKWVPALAQIDELLDAGDDQKTRHEDHLFGVRVAYQHGVNVEIPDGESGEALANTFEDALVLTNLPFFLELGGTGLAGEFQDAIKTATLGGLTEAMFASLRKGKKAEFALQVMAAESFHKLNVPLYIDEGLRWLAERLRKKQVEIVTPDSAVIQ